MSEKKTISVVSASGASSTVELPEQLFGREVNVPLIHQVVVAQQAAARQGTHSTKTRGEVSGSRSKPWRQKGTGRARHGDRIAPQFAGGGIAHGPKPRNYAQRTPKKMIRAALLGALSDRANENLIFVVDQFVEGEVPSTKQAAKVLASVGEFPRYLVVLDRSENNACLSVRNLPNVHVLAWDQLNTYDVIVSDAIVFSKAAFDGFVGSSPEQVAEGEEENK